MHYEKKHYCFIFLCHNNMLLTAICPGLSWWAGTRKVKPIWIWRKRHWVAMVSAGPYTKWHLAPRQHPATQPTVSKHWRHNTYNNYYYNHFTAGEPVPEETFTHSHLSWSSIIQYLLPPSFMIHGIILVQFMCLTTSTLYCVTINACTTDTTWPRYSLLHYLLPCSTNHNFVFTRDSIYAIARVCHGNSVCPSVTRVHQSKTAEARIMQFSPYSSPIPLVFRG